MQLMPFSAVVGDRSVSPVNASQRKRDEIERRIGRYWSRFRARLRTFAQSSERCADLLASFPAACIEIICRPPDSRARQVALDLVNRGASLSLVAAALDMPVWMRKLSPECFSHPMPENLSANIHAPDFGPKILNHLPPSSKRPDRWLRFVLAGSRLGDCDFALWLAAQRVFNTSRVPPIPLLPLALYYAFSQHNEEPVSRLMQRPWEPGMGLQRATMLAGGWLMRVLQDQCFGPACANPWTRLARVNGLDIVPLTSSAEIVEEGAAMQNCLATYVRYVVFGECRLFSIRSNGQRLATMEVRPCPSTGTLRISQIKGFHNGPTPEEAAMTAGIWLAQCTQTRADLEAFQSEQHCQALFRTRIWQPFTTWRGITDPAPHISVVLDELRLFPALYQT